MQPQELPEKMQKTSALFLHLSNNINKRPHLHGYIIFIADYLLTLLLESNIATSFALQSAVE